MAQVIIKLDIGKEATDIEVTGLQDVKTTRDLFEGILYATHDKIMDHFDVARAFGGNDIEKVPGVSMLKY